MGIRVKKVKRLSLILLLLQIFVINQANFSFAEEKLIRSTFIKKGKILFSQEEQSYLNNRGPIKMCVDPNWMPYEQINKKGIHEGMVADYIKLFQQRIGKKIVLIPTKTWSESIEFAKKKKCDILSAAAETPSRKKYLNFTKDYLFSPNVIVTKKNINFIENIKYVLDKKFAVIKNFSIAEKLVQKYPSIILIPVKNIEEGLQKVSSGEVFGYIDAISPVAYQMQKRSIFILKISGKVNLSSNSAIAVQKDDLMLLHIFQRAVNSITIEDRRKITHKWISIKYEQGFNYSLFWKIILGIFILLIIVFYWNRKLALEIRERKNMETSLRQTYADLAEEQEKLKESDAYNKVLFQGSHLPLVIMESENYEYIDCNDAALQIYGYKSKDEVLGKTPVDFSTPTQYNGEDSSVLAMEKINQALKEGAVLFEWRHQKKDGEIWDAEVHLMSLNYKSKKILQFSLLDITKRKKAEKELLKMEKLKSLGILAGGIAHDFNNILTGVYGNISLAKMKILKNKSGIEFLERAENSIERAVALTKQLLTFAKGGEPIKKNIEIDVLLEDIVKFHLAGSDIKCRINRADSLWITQVDKGQIEQVFSNLIMNARNAMPDGGAIDIDIENFNYLKDDIPSLKKGKYIKILFKDNGVGIDNKFIHKIFDPYFTTKKTGNGLGLSTVYSILNRHNGCISVESEVGLGTTFTIYIPVVELATTEDGKGIQGDRNVLNKPEKSAKILVIDDEDIICEVLLEMLNDLGYTAKSALDGNLGIKMYKEAMDSGEPFDVIITDLTIPGGAGGKEVIKEILAIDSEAKVIVSSGYASDPIMANYEKYGFTGIIAKPYTAEILQKVLVDILEKAEKL